MPNLNQRAVLFVLFIIFNYRHHSFFTLPFVGAALENAMYASGRKLHIILESLSTGSVLPEVHKIELFQGKDDFL